MKSVNNLFNLIVANKKSHFWLFFAVLLLLSSLMMYFYQPLYPGQDFFFHYRRLQALMDGMNRSPFLIYLDYNAIDGYGYFTKAFYSDFILIPFAIIGNLTSLSFAYQSLIFTSTVLCGIFTYITVNSIYKDSFAASIGALLYTFAIYRLLDIYHRAAIGEALSFTFVPIVILGLYHIIKGNYKKWYILAIGYSLLIFTHLISSVLMFLTMILFLAVYYKPLIKEPKRILYLLIAGLATWLLTSYYLLPMLEQMASNTFYYESRQIMAKAADSGLPIHWIIWGMFTGIMAPMQAFIPGIGLLLTCSVALRLFVEGKSAELRSIDIGVAVGVLYLFVASVFFPWSVFPFSLLNFIQMGWRLFEFTSFFFAVAGGYYLSQLLRTNKRMFVGGCVIVSVIAFVFINESRAYKIYRGGRPITQEASYANDYHLGGLEYIPSKVPSINYIHERGNRIISSHNATITNLNKDGGITSFDIKVNENEMLELPLIYYKGYTAEVDGVAVSVSESENGLVELSIDKSGRVVVWFGGTTIQKSGFCITIISVLGLCVYLFVQRKRREY